LNILLVLALFVSNALQAQPEADRCVSPPVLRFSIIPAGNIESDLGYYQPLLKRMEKLTGRPVSVMTPSSYRAVVEGLLGGSIHIAKLGPAAYVSARNSDSHITPFATVVKGAGVYQEAGPHYHSVLAVLSNSPHASATSLKGTRLALTDPGSTSGALLPRAQFTHLIGQTLETYFGKVSYSGSHVRSIAALAQREVDAIFVATSQLDNANASGVLPSSAVRILWKTKPIPFDPFVFHGQLCKPLQNQIRAAFLDQANEKDYADLFRNLKAIRFAPVGDAQYEGIRQALEVPGA
jgi:phosphonate transport system substrate-binding protein